jgi:DNA-binding winged helix-turn-helix (wHTH) protein
MFDFNYFKNLGINQLFISETLQILEHPNYIKSNYELNDYSDFNKDVLIVGFNFNEEEIKLICDNTNTIKYLLILEQNIKISPELLNKDFIKFIVSNKKIENDQKIVSLNGKTFDILAYLALRKQRVFSKDEIINALWEEPEYVSDNTVEVAINQIRKRLKSILGFQVIHTVRRRGYKFSY